MSRIAPELSVKASVSSPEPPVTRRRASLPSGTVKSGGARGCRRRSGTSAPCRCRPAASPRRRCAAARPSARAWARKPSASAAAERAEGKGKGGRPEAAPRAARRPHGSRSGTPVRGRSPPSLLEPAAMRRWCSRHSASRKALLCAARPVGLHQHRRVQQLVGALDAAVDLRRGGRAERRTADRARPAAAKPEARPSGPVARHRERSGTRRTRTG